MRLRTWFARERARKRWARRLLLLASTPPPTAPPAPRLEGATAGRSLPRLEGAGTLWASGDVARATARSLGNSDAQRLVDSPQSAAAVDVPPQSSGARSAIACVKVQRWPARSSTEYWRSP